MTVTDTGPARTADAPRAARTRGISGLAIASLVLGVLWLYWVGSVLALALGYVALKKIAKGQAGRGVAVAGIVLGWLGLGILVLLALSAEVRTGDANVLWLTLLTVVLLGAIAYVLTLASAVPGSVNLRESGLGYLLLLPAFAIFAVFIFYPFFRNFHLGFFKAPIDPTLPPRHVGLSQYRDVLSSSDFLDSLRYTVQFAVITVPIGIALGLLLAVLAHQKLKGIGIYRTLFSSTVATSVAVASVIFGTLLNPQVGLLPWLGIKTDPSILQNASPVIDLNVPVIRSMIPSVALVAVAVTTIWLNLGLSFILMSAGLQSVPDELLEAAEVDGAGAVSRFWHVTLPMLSPTIFFAFVVGSIFAFQTFGQIDFLTPRGGPEHTTNVLTYFIYDELQFAKNDGKAAVLAIALFSVTLLLTLAQFRFLERRVSYER